MAIDPFTYVKVIPSMVLVIVAFVVAMTVIKRNPRYWLHRFFALFFISNSVGFLIYIIYHFITDNEVLAVGLIVVTQLVFNVAFACLLMTWFIMRSSEKIAMQSKYLLPVLALFAFTCIGYFIWVPTVDPVQYQAGLVHSVIPVGWNLFITIYRIGMLGLVISSYVKWSKNADENIKRKMRLFVMGMSSVLVGLLCIFLAGFAESIEIIFTLAGLAALIVSLVYLFRALVYRLPQEKN